MNRLARSRRLPVVFAVGLAALAVSACSGTADAPPPVQQLTPGPPVANHGITRTDPLAGTRPNILFITVDDMAPRDLKWMPQVRKLIGDSGTTHTNAITPTPICAPSRASWMSGQYATNHGVHTVEGRRGGFAAFNEDNRLASWLQSAGYRTGFIGKYLNGYGMQDPTYVPPGWTDWRGSVDMATYDYSQVKLNVNGKVWHRTGYQTPIFAEQANAMIGRFAASGSPWFANINYVAPHSGGPQQEGAPAPGLLVGGRFKLRSPAVAERYRGHFSDLAMPDQPDQWKQPTDTGHPPEFTASDRAAITNVWQRRLESLQSVDDAVAGHVAALKRAGQFKNTVIVFMSDNGMSMGEHNRIGKLAPWYESLQVPLLVRGPGIAAGARSDALVTNADLPVTFAALAGAEPSSSVDGIDIAPLWTGSRIKTRSVPIVAWNVSDGAQRLWRGIRVDDDWTYTRGRREMLYDRSRDPYETASVNHEADLQGKRRELRARAKVLQKCSGASCQTVVWEPEVAATP